MHADAPGTRHNPPLGIMPEIVHPQIGKVRILLAGVAASFCQAVLLIV
jgi:hypothetical protein